MYFINSYLQEEKKEEIWLSPMTKAPTPIDKSKNQRDNTKLRSHNDCGPTQDGQLGNDSHPTGMVKPVYGNFDSNFLP